MRATPQGGPGHRLGRWRGLGIAAAVLVAGAILYPAVSAVYRAQSDASTLTVHPAALARTAPAPGNVARSGAPATTATGATIPATATPKITNTAAAASKSPAPKSPAPTPAAGSKAATGVGAVPAGASLAGRIKPGQTRSGVATFYQGAQNTGACSFDPSPDHMTAAMNEADYEGSNACGAYLQVHGSSGATITVRVTNLCPYPCRVGQLDLDPEAYKLLAPLQTGETPITWKLVSPSLSGGIEIRYKTGSTQWWCGIQVINHRNPVARLEVKVGGAWKALPRASYNYFLSAQGSGCGGQIRVSDLYGQALTVGAPAIKAEVTQPTSLQFAGH
jgi:expansin (peptidoglycan-binding protein)